jgi:DNA-binding HxlR family transcriptional regulator
MKESATETVTHAAPREFTPGCDRRVLLEHIMGKWGTLLLLALSEGPQRWSELRRRAVGISEKMLAQTLKTLEADGLVDRHASSNIPPRVDYALTDAGAELTALIVPLVDWVADYADRRTEQTGADPDATDRPI